MTAEESQARRPMKDREKLQRLYDSLKRIALYDPPERVRRDAAPMGLDENEAVGMAYENVISEAKAAIHRMRRPK
jgi:hypothetical protein